MPRGTLRDYGVDSTHARSSGGGLMQDSEASRSESRRLEELWSGEFGDAYVERNRAAGAARGPFWEAMLEELPARRVLEVGCNVGANLGWLARLLPHQEVYGVDV